MRRVTAILGAEPYHDPHNPDVIKYYADTFLDVADTWAHDNPEDKMTIIDARSFLKHDMPLTDLWKAVCDSHDEIDVLLYCGHSSPEHLLVFAHCRLDLDETQRFLGVENAYKAPFSEKAVIRLMGCQTCGKEGKRLDECIGQTIADKTGKVVHGFISRSSQRKRKDGKYVMIPDSGGVVEVKPRHVDVV